MGGLRGVAPWGGVWGGVSVHRVGHRAGGERPGQCVTVLLLSPVPSPAGGGRRVVRTPSLRGEAKMSVTSDEVNFLVYRYLQESGKGADTPGSRSGDSRRPRAHPPGCEGRGAEDGGGGLGPSPPGWVRPPLPVSVRCGWMGVNTGGQPQNGPRRVFLNLREGSCCSQHLWLCPRVSLRLSCGRARLGRNGLVLGAWRGGVEPGVCGAWLPHRHADVRHESLDVRAPPCLAPGRLSARPARSPAVHESLGLFILSSSLCYLLNSFPS